MGMDASPRRRSGAPHGRRRQPRRQARFAVDNAPYRAHAPGAQWLSTTLTIGSSSNLRMVRAVHTKLLSAWSSVVDRKALKTSLRTFLLPARSKLAATGTA